MRNYSYTARDTNGRPVRGTMLADDEIDLSNKTSRLGCFLIRARVVKTASESPAAIARMTPREILNFTIYLATMFNSGVSLITGLKDLSRDAEKESIKEIMDDLRNKIESGTSLKEALSFHPRSFPSLYTAIVGAGESTGKLGPCLNDLANLLEWQMELKTKMKEAATYPIILFCVMIAVVTLLVIKVIPTFEPMFKEAGAALPLPTRIVLSVSHGARDYWYMILGLLIAAAAGCKFYNSSAGGRYKLDSLKLRFPLFGTLLRKIALARFCHTLALGLKSGVNILTALDFSLEVINNRRLERAIANAKGAVNRGEKIAGSLQASGEFPPLVVRMIAVGEQTGSLFQALEKVNRFYDREVPATIKRIFALMEPIMIIFMGVVVGGIALAIFLPMFQMSQFIGG